ncbi:MAG TPA: DNA polymerase domain-containing protein [Kiritimatiellia bacterium]|nr:DNA polymerase domain-containing protein [Kiritimatiellia bacterium]
MSADHPADELIFGWNADTGLVDVEHRPGRKGHDEMVLFVRRGDETVQETEPFTPFLWVESEGLLTGYAGPCEVHPLAGNNPLHTLVTLSSWKEFQKLIAWLKQKTRFNPSDPSAPFFLLNDPVQQHLMFTGRTLFKGMTFSQVRRLQVDIETYTAGPYEFSNAAREGDRIIAIALADQTGWSDVLSGSDLDERALLERFVALVRERDPDVIEGHNIFKFDFPYLIARAELHDIKLALGRDGSKPSVRPGRFNMAERTISYPKIDIHGRHVADTFFLAQAYDVSHRSLDALGLKDVALHFGVAESDRTYLDGDEIAHTFDKDPAKVMKYALDDIRETRSISNVLSPSYFVQSQILPFTYQNICVRGSGARIDALILREYLHVGHSIPRPDQPREFAGGYTDIFHTGVVHDVHHCDVRSLYPSIILRHSLAPRTDELSVFLCLLDYLRTLRLDSRARMKKAGPDELHHLDALQSTLKILINSFYGYLGFSQARFSDYDMAERVTAEGRAILQQMIDWIRKHDGKPIEIDTDGVYFLPPKDCTGPKLDAFRKDFQASLPQGIDIEFDGEYPAMFSYKMKNYALLDERGEIIIKGAALKSRGLEPFQRDFLEEWLRLTLESRDAEIPKLVARYRDAIENRRWPIRKLAKTETLQDAPSTYSSKVGTKSRGRNAAYELALRSGRDYRAGDQVSYYVTGTVKSVAVHSSAKLVADWNPDQRDENVPYYLAKLDALCGKFDAMAADDTQAEFDLGMEPDQSEDA